MAVTTQVSSLITPYGEKLIDLMAPDDDRDDLKAYAGQLPSLQLSERSVCDLELLATGAFSPLDRFMGSQDHQRVLDDMRLVNGRLFPLPIPLPVDPDPALRLDGDVALRNARNELLAVMTVEDMYPWDLTEVAQKVCGTQDPRHPLVSEMYRWGKLNLSGRLRVLKLPDHYDFQTLRLTPAQTRGRLDTCGRSNVTAFQTCHPLHRVHEELTKRAIQDVDGVLLLHPVVGLTKPGDMDHYTRVHTYKVFAEQYYDTRRIVLSLLPLAMRMAGPREALWHALIRRNYGANHLIVEKNHASPGVDSTGKPYYGPYDAQEIVAQFQDELGVHPVVCKELVYLTEEERYEEVTNVPPHAAVASLLSGTQVREEYLNKGRRLPQWFTRPEAAEILADAYPPRHRQGVAIWLTGLSGAGKSTTTEVVTVLLMEHGRQVTVLDGDVVRTHLSKGLGFSRADRDINIRRIGYVAAELVRHGGVVVCATVSPYRSTRNDVRHLVPNDQFIEVFVDTPLDVCEARDAKGMYAKARRGEITGFTGIDDPYEAPLNPEITLDTVQHTPEENARRILDELMRRGFVRGGAPS